MMILLANIVSNQFLSVGILVHLLQKLKFDMAKELMRKKVKMENPVKLVSTHLDISFFRFVSIRIVRFGSPHACSASGTSKPIKIDDFCYDPPSIATISLLVPRWWWWYSRPPTGLEEFVATGRNLANVSRRGGKNYYLRKHKTSAVLVVLFLWTG